MTINPLVAARVNGPVNDWSGVWIAEDIQLLTQGVRNGSWIDTSLGVVGAGLDALAFVSDPVGTTPIWSLVADRARRAAAASVGLAGR